jgi:methylenetetrahydrofolate--tRNA-(uracil-5-)-methyltransferase
VHRNTFLNSPQLLDETLRLKASPHIRFAGQITGCEGYVESAAMGFLAAKFAAAEAFGRIPNVPPLATGHGALLAHVTGRLAAPGGVHDFQPMNVNFGLFPPIDEPVRDAAGNRLRGKAKAIEKRRALSRRALRAFEAWLGETQLLAA